jgi:ATP-dependent DNA helicase RecG
MSDVDLEGIRRLISEGESETLEFKRSIAERETAAKTICGMLNSARGGTVLFGVNDDGQIVGIDVGQRTHDQLRGELRKIDPLSGRL